MLECTGIFDLQVIHTSFTHVSLDICNTLHFVCNQYDIILIACFDKKMIVWPHRMHSLVSDIILPIYGYLRLGLSTLTKSITVEIFSLQSLNNTPN